MSTKGKKTNSFFVYFRDEILFNGKMEEINLFYSIGFFFFANFEDFGIKIKIEWYPQKTKSINRYKAKTNTEFTMDFYLKWQKA